MSKRLLVTLIVFAPLLARAGKPSAAQAMDAAHAWITALEDTANGYADAKADADSVDRLAALTALPFSAAVFYEGEGEEPSPACEGSTCKCQVSVAAAAELGPSRECLKHVATDGNWSAFPSKAMSRLWGGVRDHKKTITKLAKTHRLVQIENPMCGNAGGWVILAVTLGKDKVARVDAVFAQDGFCGE